MYFDDGTGKGYRAKVDKHNRLWVNSLDENKDVQVNRVDGEAYAAYFAVNPDGDGDCFFYLKNNDDKDLIIPGIWLQLSAAEEVYFNIGATGNAAKTSGADIIPVNLNAGSGNVASVTCYSNIGDGAVDITGLSGGSNFHYIWFNAAGDSKYFEFPQRVVVPKNKTFSIWAVDGDALIRGTLEFNFQDAE
jgi:hypothetical protein